MPLAEVKVAYIGFVGMRNLVHPSTRVGYRGRVVGRPPRTVCRNGGTGLARSGTGPYPFFELPRMDVLYWIRSILKQACGE